MDTLNEIEAKQRAERRQIREDAELLNDLMRHKGWGRYVSIIEQIAQNYYKSVIRPIDNALECVSVEYAKGVLNGISISTNVPNMKIREAHELRLGDVDE